MAAPTSILVLGAGELGTAILSALATHPSRTTTTALSVLLRPSTIASPDPAKRALLSRLRAQNITLIPGDVVHDSEAHLAALFAAHDTLVNATGMALPPGTQTRICRAALASGCARYFPWQFGVDYDVIGPDSSQDLFTEQLGVRALLRGQEGMEWVIVSTGMFTSFLFEPAFGLVGAGRDVVTGIGGWGNAITVTSPRDIGRVVAELALVDVEVKGVVFTAGDTVTMARLAEIVEGVTGREVMRELKGVEQLKEELKENPEDGMRKYRVVFAEGVGVSWEKEKTFNVQRGMEMESAEDWARANLKGD